MAAKAMAAASVSVSMAGSSADLILDRSSLALLHRPSRVKGSTGRKKGGRGVEAIPASLNKKTLASERASAAAAAVALLDGTSLSVCRGCSRLAVNAFGQQGKDGSTEPITSRRPFRSFSTNAAVGQAPTEESAPARSTPSYPGSSSGVQESEERIGVLLLNLGGPETLDDVQPFLFNLFADPDIIRLPRLLSFLQRPLAQFISTSRAPKSQEGYKSIGGGSPLRRITDEQAEAIREALATRNQVANVYVGMRYWHPFTEEAIEQIKADRVTRLVVLPLYPQFSISTSGSSLRLLERLFREDPYLANMPHTVIPSWYQRKGYVKAMSDLIEEELVKFDAPEEVRIFFSAHGVPESYVSKAGDPYKAEMEECIDLIMSELRTRGIENPGTLAYQSRVGPVEWLKPYTDDTIRELGAAGTKSLLAVPISFVSEHIETLEEIDIEYRELAHESGIEGWGRVPALNCNQTFIDDLADAVVGALPFVGAMSPLPAAAAAAGENVDGKVRREEQQPPSLVPVGSVEALLEAYDKERMELPLPVKEWQWGFTASAETWNGRVAIVAVVLLILIEVATGSGVLHNLGIL